jgi:DNA-directed RNA polymerase beta subunit
MTIQRFGRAFSPKLEILKKFLRSIPNDGTYGITYRLGNSYEVNKHFDTMMEYDDLAKEIYILTIQSKDRKNEFTLCLNQANIRTKFEELDIAYVPVPGTLPVGFVRSAETGNISRVIEFDTDTGYSKDLKNKGTLSEVILGVIQDWAYVPDLDKRLSKITAPSRYMYSRMEYVNYKISVGSFLGILYGLTGLLRKMAEDGLKYEIYDARKKRTPDEANTQNFIRFKNKYLYYNVTPVRHALILNGIAKEVACENFDIEEMDTREPYLQACEEMFQTRHVEKAYDLCKQFMIDPVDKQVLNKLGLPTDFLEVMLYASSLLENNHVDDPKRIQNLRLRKLELIPIFMYKSMVRAYQDYRYMYTKNGKMTSKPNDVIKRMTESQLFNDYDVLNPIREMECEAEATFKGPGGCRVEDAYTLSRRAYDKSMVGICATSGPDGPGIGINKFLSMNPRVSNLLGFMNAGDESDTNDIGFGNIGSIAELSVPFPINHDDARRLSFVAKESKHLTAVADTDPPLIGNGVEKVMPYMCSSDFIVTAKHDGRVLKVDKELGVAIVEYEDGTVESIDITDRQQKDGGMGIYVVCKKEFEYKEGEKFKANSVLVKNPSFFSTHSGSSAPQFNSGTLAWVGVLMSPVTFEDSSVITERIAEKMVTEVIIKKSVVIGAKSRLIQMVNIGDYVKTGEPLITYQNELSDDEINTVVNGAGDDDDMSNLDSIINTRVKSKVTGFVHDVRIYYTVPERDQSETIAKTVNAYNKRLSARKNMIKKFNAKESDELIQDHIGVSLPGAGEKVNGEYCPLGNILIEIYVKYRDYPGAGDKITYYCSMKSVLCRTLPMKYAPYPVGKKEERPLDGVLSIISIEARQVSSIMYALYGGKCVWALKERIRDIYNKYAKKERDSKK